MKSFMVGISGVRNISSGRLFSGFVFAGFPG
jgi:hypothetical protein